MLLTIDFAVIVTLTAVIRAAALKLEITPPGDKSVKSQGSSALFTCVASSVNDNGVNVQWQNSQGRRISDDVTGRIYVVRINSLSAKLYITSIQQEDAGQYVCTAGIQKKSVELIYFKDITFDHAPSPQHPKINATALIECRVSSSPAPDVSWRYNGKPLVTGGRYREMRDGLQIRDITLADDGNYTCCVEVESEGLYKERTIAVAVHIPPRVVTGPGTIDGVEGREVTMFCRATGLPLPKFEFIKDTNWEVLSSRDHIHIDPDAGRITFRPLKRDDDGMYTCRAVNDVGNDSKSGRLNVHVHPSITELHNITRSESERGTLVCRASGHPAPEMYFQREGDLLPYMAGNNEQGRISVLKFSSSLEMTISNLSPLDATNYTCFAQNVVGQANKTGFIDVQFRPRFDEDTKRTVYGWAGTWHNISCNVLAQPPPAIRWVRHGRQLADNETFHIFYSGKQSNLQVRIKETDQSWIYGEYVCQANNSKGNASETFHLNRATVPDRPVRVTNIEVTPNQVVLGIVPPRENGGINIIGYRVEFENNIQDVSVSEPLERVIDDDMRPYRNSYGQISSPNRYADAEVSIDNLRPGTRYIFRIRAKNEVGVGGSMEHMVTTANLTKPYPIKLTSPRRGIYARQYNITWATPKTGGQPIRSYEFRYRKLKSTQLKGTSEKYSTKSENWITVTEYDNPTPPMREYRLNRLEPSTEYQLQVVARNELGASVPNEYFTFVTSAVDPPLKYFSATAVPSFSGHAVSWVHFAALLLLLASKFAAE